MSKALNPDLTEIKKKTIPAEIIVIDNERLERKIGLAIEGFTTKFCELLLKNRSRLSKENAMTASNLFGFDSASLTLLDGISNSI
jgi:hypothetical protein